MTVFEARSRLERRLTEAGVASAAVEAELLLGALLGLARTELLSARGRTLQRGEEDRLEVWLTRRASREPLQHILGAAHFYGLELRVTPDVLIPRPETEGLVELALQLVEDIDAPKLLDVGSGSGAVALALKHERRGAVVMATDVSAAALSVAAENAARYSLEVAFLVSDLLSAPEVSAFAADLDLLVANLPYLPEADRAWVSPEVRRDPALALYAGRDGLALFRRLEREARGILKRGAWAVFELDPRNVRQAQALTGGWTRAEVLPDLVGRARYLRLER